MKFDEIDRVLSDKLKDFEFEASSVPAWEDFEVAIRPKKRRILPLITIASMAVAACIMAAMLYIQPLTHYQFTLGTITIPQILSQSSPEKEIISDSTKNNRYTITPICTHDLNEIANMLENNKDSTTQSFTQESNTETKKPKNEITKHDYKYYNQFEQDIVKKKKSRPMIAMSAYTSISNINSKPNYNDTPMLGVGNLGIVEADKSVFYAMGEYRDMVNLKESDFEHKFPVSVGLNVDIEVAKNLSVLTGISYSYLESNATTTNRNFTYKYKQSINYLGIPIGVSYKLLSSKVVDLYVTAGVGVDFAVSKKGVTEAYRNDSFISSQETAVEPEIVQLSANLGAGININITPVVGFYLEPNVGHYFKGDDSPITYRTESPIRFGLKTGFKFKF